MSFRLLMIAGSMLMVSGCEVLMVGNILLGCATRPEPTLMPKELPVAEAGKPYSVRIEVINASTPVSRLLVAPAHPLPGGLILRHDERERHALIQGAPTQAGTYDVLIYGHTFGTQCTGQRLERRYELEVR